MQNPRTSDIESMRVVLRTADAVWHVRPTKLSLQMQTRLAAPSGVRRRGLLALAALDGLFQRY